MTRPTEDPFGTDAIRTRVLDAWRASPARFREDANAEEDYALGGYRDRLLVELAQNAADAAARAGVPGRLLVSFDGDRLTVANTGAPLDAAGVESLSTLRASAKRDDEAASVGRFGVGFAAVLSVSDEPQIRSTSGAVAWSTERTRRALQGEAQLADELTRRAGAVPVLRLPWPADGRPPEGYDTVVVLPCRDDAARRSVESAVGAVDAALLLMLPALAEVVVEAFGARRVLRAEDLRVRTRAADGQLEAGLLADRPTEERRMATWWVRWALPRPSGVPAVVHAPTPTDEPLDLPGLLMASFPLDPSRRHVSAGPLAERVAEHAAEVYVALVREVAAEGGGPDDIVGLVPGPAPAGAVDAVVRAAVRTRLATAAILPGGVVPGEAVAVDGLPALAVTRLTGVLPGLLPPAWAARRELDGLGVRRLRLADLVDELAGLERPAAWWRELYEGLVDADREPLAGLPVPLVDGRLVRGPRGVVVGAGRADDDLARRLPVLGLRVVHPEAAHPLLERLGAVAAEPAALLADPAVRAAVEGSLDADDPAPLADAVLALVAGAGLRSGAEPWLGMLALPDDTGGWTPAAELLIPDAPFARLLEPGEVSAVAAGTVTRWGTDVLVAVGCLATFGTVEEEDVALDPDLAEHDLDGEADWADDVLDRIDEVTGSDRPTTIPPTVARFTAVRDLDLVAEAAWPDALRLLAADPTLRAAVVHPARVLLDGRALDVPSYTAWWLREHVVLAGRRPGELRAPGSDATLAPLMPTAPEGVLDGLDPEFLRAIGLVTTVADLADSPMDLPLLRAGKDPVGAVPDAAGVTLPVPGVVERVLPEAPTTYAEHADLTVAGVACDWWIDAAGTVHAATLDGLARGLAWAAGRWGARWVVAAALAEPERADELLAEAAWDQ